MIALCHKTPLVNQAVTGSEHADADADSDALAHGLLRPQLLAGRAAYAATASLISSKSSRRLPNIRE